MQTLSTMLQIKNAKAGVYSVKGASGFGFKKASDEPETGSYTVRYRFNGRRPTMGLGSFREILAEAREAAKDAVRLARKGVDPIKARERLKTENLAAERAGKPVVFEQMIESYLKTRKWRHKHAVANWVNPVKAHALVTLAGLSLEQITIAHIIAVIERAETVSEETARRVLSRVGATLDAAIALSGKATRNPADAKLIEKIHPLKRHGPRQNFRRLELGAAQSGFLALQEARERAQGLIATSLDAWLVMISGGLRPSEALRCRWAGIDFDNRLLTLSPGETKSLREHTVPLSSLALRVLERRLKARTSEQRFVFASPARGAPPSYATFVRAPSEMGLDLGTPHSWRSIFRDWAGDIGRIDRDLAEAALAHSLGATEASYRRQTAVEARRGPMERYADWLCGGDDARVSPFPRALEVVPQPRREKSGSKQLLRGESTTLAARAGLYFCVITVIASS
ncbi:MAG TPA: tyrosine-type recombinase/integrase [Roseiarcus sp.]|jgi:integrase|nr:tyrosine-type recombinase/integrase [Roseiarcus sp.]